MLVPAERLALMLHDMFAIAFDDITATPPAAHEWGDSLRARACVPAPDGVARARGIRG
jgi:hypothetical protein